MKKEDIENNKNYFYWGFTIFAVIAAAIIFFFILYRFSTILGVLGDLLKILTPIIYGLLLAYVMAPVLNYLEKKFFIKLSKKIFKKKRVTDVKFARIMSIITTIIIYLILVFGFIFLVIPALFNSIQGIIANIPGYFNDGRDWIIGIFDDSPEINEIIIDNYQDVTNGAINFINNSLVPGMDNVLSTISTGIIDIVKFFINLIVGLIISIYVLYSKEKFIAQTKKLMYAVIPVDRAKSILENVRYVHKVFSGFLFGKVIDSLIIGMLCFVFMLILDLPYAPLISVIVGITNIIPYFGPFIGAIPSAILILLVDPSKCLVFIVFIFILQQFDGNILGPKILGEKTGLSSFWVLFSILVFGGIFGFAGMIFGVPLFSVIYAVTKGYCKQSLKKKKLATSTEDYEKINYIDVETSKPIYFK